MRKTMATSLETNNTGAILRGMILGKAIQAEGKRTRVTNDEILKLFIDLRELANNLFCYQSQRVVLAKTMMFSQVTPQTINMQSTICADEVVEKLPRRCE